MTAGEYCNREVSIIEPDASVTEAAAFMRRQHVGDLVVIEKQGEKNMPIGIITDRDIVIEVIAQSIEPGSLLVKDVMSGTPVTVGEKVTLLDTLDLMQKKGVRRVLIVDEQGGLQGLLSADDVIELIAEQMNNLTKLVRHEITREQKEHP